VLLDLLLLSFISSLVGWLIMFEYPDAEAIIHSASTRLSLLAVRVLPRCGGSFKVPRKIATRVSDRRCA